MWQPIAWRMPPIFVGTRSSFSLLTARGRRDGFLLSSERFNTRATHIQCCPGQPRTAATDHQRCPANRVRSATASGYVALRLAEDEFRGKEIILIEAAFSSFPAGVRR